MTVKNAEQGHPTSDDRRTANRHLRYNTIAAIVEEVGKDY